MAELISKLQALLSLPEQLHWFCTAWTFDDEQVLEQAPIKLESILGQDVAFRRQQAAECLTVYAYDDASSYQQQYGQALDRQLARCDQCIEEYYKAKQIFVDGLRHDYGEEEVRVVEMSLDLRDFERINKGLDNALHVLQELEPKQRHQRMLPPYSQMAMFEALCSDAYSTNAEAITNHFHQPFKLAQTNRPLNPGRYLSAATTFVFDADPDRFSWAAYTWSKHRASPSKEDFDFSIRMPLLRALQSVHLAVSDAESLERVWRGVSLIVENLNNDLVTHSLRALDVDVFKLALDHLRFDVPGFRYVVETIKKLLEIAPRDFWDAMGSISAATFVEQIFNNAQFSTILMSAKPQDIEDTSPLKKITGWIKPILASLDVAHQANVCRILAHQLMERYQASKYPAVAKAECFRSALAAVGSTTNMCNKDITALTSSRRIVASDTLAIVSEYAPAVIRIPSLPDSDMIRIVCADLGLRLFKNALTLECRIVRADLEALKRDNLNTSGTTNYAAHASVLWDTAVQNMDYGNIKLAKTVLAGINELTGLEKFKVSADDAHSKDKSAFNIKLGRLLHLVCQVFERLADYSPTDLDGLYQSPESAPALIAALFAADANLYQAGTDLIKHVSSELGRKEALAYLLRSFFATTLDCLSLAIRRIKTYKTYASCSRALKTSTDVLDILCDAQDGILRTGRRLNEAERKSLETFWQCQWEELKVIYETTEDWGKNKVDDSETLKELCRDTMQFSDKMFEQYLIFAQALDSASSAKAEGDHGGDRASNTKVEEVQNGKVSSAARSLLQQAASTFPAMVRWLRLRDLFLVDIAVKVTIKFIERLCDLQMPVNQSVCDFLEQVVSNTGAGRTHLSPSEKAQLARALEQNLGRSLTMNTEQVEDRGNVNASTAQPVSAARNSKSRPNGKLDLEAWRKKAERQTIEISDDDADVPVNRHDDLHSVSRSAEPMKRMKEQQAAGRQPGVMVQVPAKKRPEGSKLTELAETRQTSRPSDQVSFREKREKEREAKKKRDLENIAMLKRRAGVAGVPTTGGSGLDALGVPGKDHGPKGPSMMVSSASNSETEGSDLDAEIFGGNGSKGPKRVSAAVKEFNASRSAQSIRGPVKKARQIRSAKDMRARLAPDLTPLHKTILAWEFFHNGDFPPGSQRQDYSLVSSTFRTPVDYEQVFEPLLILEAWQGILQSKEEGTFKAFEITVASRMNVDAFLEVSTSMSSADAKELGIGEADIILLSKGRSPATDQSQPHCLSRIWKVNRKKGTLEITFRTNVHNPLAQAMVPNATIQCAKVTSITPLEREYGALLGLKYFDLCDEITRAQPSPLLEYSERQLQPIAQNYQVNPAQAKAIRSALDNDAFTLIQGPPGSGKTKTIVAIVGALLNDSFGDTGYSISRPQNMTSNLSASASKKLLVCAPSNAAVDELVMRFKAGIRGMQGQTHVPSVIRLGRSDAINTNVMDVTLEELVNAKLNLVSKKAPNDDVGQIMQEHKITCERLNDLRRTVDSIKASGKSVAAEQNRDLEHLKRHKQQLSNRIDQARDSGATVARDAEINRRKLQQEIMDGAHIICATLSGSGHEMFQGLNVEFETVVIDEAAQSIELSALIPLKYGCSKCILVGDPKQLPPTVLSREAARFQYEQSLFVRMQLNHPRDVHLLDTQYRMHPAISAFPSTAFYEGRLLDGVDMAKLRTRPWHQAELLGPYRFFDVQGSHQSAPRGHSLINVAEIDVALKLYDRLLKDCKGYNFAGKVGIITPYKSQLRELRSRFSRTFGDSILANVEFNTTDAFQGRESEIIIFSCVRASVAKGIGFLSDIRRMNVGITRAMSSLWVLGNSQSLMQGEYWSRMINNAKERSVYTCGDLAAMLSKPLLKLSEQDSDMKSKSGPSDIQLEDSGKKESSDHLGKSIPHRPSGGGNGLNTARSCAVCGSFAHNERSCDNETALESAHGRCYRCNEIGHRSNSCTVERCVACGGIGHNKFACHSHKALSNKEQQRLGRQEIMHKMIQERKPDIQRKKQLGDHDPKVPMVQRTAKTPPPSPAPTNMEEEKEAEKKRKRESLSPATKAPKGPRIASSMNGVNHHSLQQKHSVPTSDPRQNGHSGPPNGRTATSNTSHQSNGEGAKLSDDGSNVAGDASSHQSVSRPPQVPIRPQNPQDPQHSRDPRRHGNSQHPPHPPHPLNSHPHHQQHPQPQHPQPQHPQPQLPPRPPRPQHHGRPHKKRAVDPFIRPKKK